MNGSLSNRERGTVPCREERPGVRSGATISSSPFDESVSRFLFLVKTAGNELHAIQFSQTSYVAWPAEEAISGHS